MIRFLVASIFVVFLVNPAHAGYMNQYPLNASPEITDQATGIDDPTGTWSVNRFSFSSIWALYQAQGYTPTGSVDLTSASSVTSGPLAWSASATLPGTPTDGQFAYYSGGTFDVMGFYNSDTWRYFLAFDSFPDTSGQALLYDGAGGFGWAIPGSVTADSVTTFTNKTYDADGTGNVLSNVDVANFAPSAVETSAEGLTDTDGAFPTSAAVKAYADALAISGSTPTVQAADPTIASNTGYYISSVDWQYFWSEYGVRTVNLTAATLDDSDMTAPVGVADTDGTHTGTGDSITSGIDWTETYLDTSSITCTVVNATPTNPTITTVGNASDTEALTPDGTGTVTCTWNADDLAGNSATPVVQEFTYSGGACMSGTYNLAWDSGYTDDTDKACLNSGASTVDGTVTGGTLTTAGYAVTGRDQNIVWPVTIDPNGPGTIFIEFNTSQVTGTQYLCEMYYDTDNRMAIRAIDGSSLSAFRYNAGSTETVTASGVAFTRGATVTVGLTWEVGHATNDWEITVDSGSTWSGDGVDGLVNMAGSPTSLILGESYFGGTDCSATFTKIAYIPSWEATCPW